jgi:hypothetical protein
LQELATYAGRVGGLAVALGIGAWLAATPWLAAAHTGLAAVDSAVSDPSVLFSPAAAEPSGFDLGVPYDGVALIQDGGAAAGTGLDVADLDGFLQDIGLGSLVTNNDFLLETDSGQSIGQWFFETSSIELFNLLNGIDETTLTTQFILDLSPAAQDLGDILNGTGDLGTELSQLAPDIAQAFDESLQVATGLFLSA